MADLRVFVPDTSGDNWPRQIADTDRADFGAGGATAAGDIALTGGAEVTGLPSTPGDATAATSKAYVDSLVAQTGSKSPVKYATTAALPANTASGTGVGKTLTADADGAISIDGASPAVTDRILVKNEGGYSADIDNGIYVVTATGDVDDPWVLTRATDFDEDAEVFDGVEVAVTLGTQNAETKWRLTTSNPITVDTTALQFENSLQPGMRSITEVMTASENISAGDPVEWGGASNQIRQCRANTQARLDMIGVALEAITSGSQGMVCRLGVAKGVLSGATAGDRYYVGNTGGLALYSAVTAGNYLVVAGTAKNATDLEIRNQYIGTK